jgi:hypothetical protein
MAVDLQRVAKAIVDATLQQPTGQANVKKPRRQRLAGGRAFLVGAGLVTAARLLAGDKGREMLESIQQRVEESDWYGQDGGADGEAEEFEDEGPEGGAEEDFEDEEPEGGVEEDFDDEDLEDDDLEGDDEGLEDEGPAEEADEESEDEELQENHPRWSGTRRVKGAAAASRGR